MKLGCVNTLCRKDVKEMEQTNCEPVLRAATLSVCAVQTGRTMTI